VAVMARIVHNKGFAGIAFLSIFLFFSIASIGLSACPSELPLDCGGWCCPDEGFENCEEMIAAGWCLKEKVDDGGGICPFSYLLGEEDPRLDLLRQFRDEVLSQSPAGREIVDLYYQFSHSMVRIMEKDEEFKKDVAELLEKILGLLAEGK
jgi:hypothetical protein